MPINADHRFLGAEKKYLQAITIDEKIIALKEMISYAPSHKGGENLRAELKTRLKKLLEKKEKSKSIGKTTQKSIRKEGFQFVILGLPNSGKSTLLASLTNASPKITSVPFSTQQAEVGTLDYKGIKAQIIDLPAIGSENLDLSLLHTADSILIVLESLKDLEKISKFLDKTKGKKLFIFSKTDLLSENEKRKLSATIKSKKIQGMLISSYDFQSILKLKDNLIEQMAVVRIFLKEPGKQFSQIPLVMPSNSCVKEALEKILKGLSSKVKEIRVTGPSSKFPNQKVGLAHILKDHDILEFHQ